MLKKPCSENRNGSLGKAALGSPRVALHHAHLLKRPLLPERLVKNPKPWCFSSACAGCNGIFLTHGSLGGLNLTRNPISQTSEMPWHGFRSQRGVDRGGSVAGHGFEGRHHRLHLVTIVSVPSVHLKKKIDIEAMRIVSLKIRCHEKERRWALMKRPAVAK